MRRQDERLAVTEMTINNYTELLAAIANFLNRDDLGEVSKTFVQFAEADIQRQIRNWRQEKRAEANLDTEYSALPADYYQTIRMTLNSSQVVNLELLSQFGMAERQQKSGNVSGTPKYYAITSNQIQLFPTPDAPYSTQLYYYSKIEPLSDTNPTNWLLDTFPDCYLYSSLVHSAPYLNDDQRIQMWSALQASSIASINMDSQKSEFGGSGRRLKITSY